MSGHPSPSDMPSPSVLTADERASDTPEHPFDSVEGGVKGERRRNIITRILGGSMILLVRGYQMTLGQFFATYTPGMCIYEPSCSHYMIGAIRHRGPIIGLLLGCWRLLRCNPFARGGYDPVPEKNHS